MKQLTFSFLCLLLGSVLVCTSFVMAAEPAATEGNVQDEKRRPGSDSGAPGDV